MQPCNPVQRSSSLHGHVKDACEEQVELAINNGCPTCFFEVCSHHMFAQAREGCHWPNTY
jgi:hypothetical protein